MPGSCASVLRRRFLDIPRWVPLPPLTFRVDPHAGLRVRFRRGPLAIECLLPGPPRPPQTLLLPFDALKILEGRDDSPVTLERDGPQRTLASWIDFIAMRRSYEVPRLVPPFPRIPAEMHDAPGELLIDLCDDSSWAGWVRFEAATREVVTLDGFRWPLPPGYSPPWDGDVVVAPAGVLRRREFSGPGLEIGREGGHVALRIGTWTVWLAEVAAIDPDAEE